MGSLASISIHDHLLLGAKEARNAAVTTDLASVCSALPHLLHQMQHLLFLGEVSSGLAGAGDGFSRSLLRFAFV